MLACLAVLQDPDGEQIVAAGRSGYGRQGASGASCAVRGAGGRGQHAGFWPGEEECMESAPSRTAMFAAVSRGLFRLETASPWVLDDPLALVLVGPVWQQLRDQFDPLFPGPVRREARAAVCTRSRYAEDRLAAGTFGQYVILGAGLDSFAWRRPDLLGSLTVFEVDHPASLEARAGQGARPAAQRLAGIRAG
jgi:O-methyltransferase involved in polyketide biosynthesis